MPISAPPTIPQITDPSTFATRAQAWVVWQADELYPALEDSATILTLSTSSTSTTSNTIGTGSKSFTVETGKGYLAGQSLSIAYTTTPTNRMFAVVTSYNSGTGALVVNVQAVEGSGTYTAWSIALAFNGVIGTGQIGANAVTLAKLARVGTAGQFLQSQGAGTDPAYVSIPAVIGTLIGFQVFTATGNYTKATNNPSFVVVEVIGGGGGGGGASAGNYFAAGGGGGGGYALEKISAASLASSETATVGAGGTAGSTAGGTGGTGGTSSFGAFCSATGGSGGAGATGATAISIGGTAGSGAGGDYNSVGGCGTFSQPSTTVNLSSSGAGGTSLKGGGGNSRSSNGTGVSATANTGGGGGGAVSANGSASAGGVGGSGLVIVWEYA